MQSVERARAADAGALRHLQAETAQAGAVRLALVADCVPERTLVARDDTGAPIAMATRTEHTLWVDGERRRVAYLGGLRVDAAHRGNPRLVARGFRVLREALAAEGHAWALTAILSENAPARRLLERGARGFPTYAPVAELATSVLAAHGRAAHAEPDVSPTRVEELPELAELFEEVNRDRQFANAWSAEELGGPGLADFIALRERGVLTACAALWDRSNEQRAIVKGYAPGLTALRPLANALAPLGGWPRLPRPGTALRSVFLSHLAVRDDDPERFARLVRGALAVARQRGFELVVLGFDVRHPLRAVLARRFARRPLASRLYAVHWERGADQVTSLGDRLSAPEVARL